MVLLALIGPNWLTIADNYGRRRLDNETDWGPMETARALDGGIRMLRTLALAPSSSWKRAEIASSGAS